MLANKQQILAAIEQIVGSPDPIGEEIYSPYDGRNCINIMTQNDHWKVQNFANLLAQQISNNIVVKLRKTAYSQIVVKL
jgi:hypothetical protein